jgi:hypothetical protein
MSISLELVRVEPSYSSPDQLRKQAGHHANTTSGAASRVISMICCPQLPGSQEPPAASRSSLAQLPTPSLARELHGRQEAVAFYRVGIRLRVLETFRDSYGLDGTILGLPGGLAHLEIVRLTERASPRADLISWRSTFRMLRPGSW